MTGLFVQLTVLVQRMLNRPLVIVDHGQFVHLTFRTLGGGQSEQLSIVLASAYVVAEFIDLFKGLSDSPGLGTVGESGGASQMS